MSRNPDNRKALGKGLSALLPSRTSTRLPEPAPVPAPPVEPGQPPISPGLQFVKTDQIAPNPLQPRTVFQPEKLSDLAQSIQSNGIVQPLIVQRVGDQYQLVAGERRWRAAKIAGLNEVPVVVREFASDRILEIALIENIQREDLNPIEIAQALERLGREYGLSHEEIGQRTGKNRTTVTNLLRLLKLPKPIQLLVAEQRLSMGHARAILSLPTEAEQRKLAERVAEEGLSVRQVERLAQNSSTHPKSTSASTEPSSRKKPDANVAAAMRELEAALGTRVKITAVSDDRGRIEIEYYSAEELDRIYTHIIGER